jgi:hypothetical protein
MSFLPRSGCRIQPRVSTLGNIQEKRFALKGREITWAKCVRLLPKRVRKEARIASGITEWKRNCLRHSFCSYHYAMYEDAGKTAAQAGTYLPGHDFRQSQGTN